MELLRQLCLKYQIALCYLFGSCQKEALQLLEGKKLKLEDPLTDIDLGIIFLKPIEEISNRRLLYAQLYNELSDLFTPYPLDLVFLQENHSVFQSQAIIGTCLYSCSQEFQDSYEEMVLRRCADFNYVLNKYYQERLED